MSNLSTLALGLLAPNKITLAANITLLATPKMRTSYVTYDISSPASIPDELIFELEESTEGYNKERLIWILNLLVTLFILALNALFLAVYYLFPRIRKNYTSNITIKNTGKGAIISDDVVSMNQEGRKDDHVNNENNFTPTKKIYFNSNDPNSLPSLLTENSETFWDCPNQCCLHLTWGSLLFLFVKVTVDIFFLKVRYLSPAIMVFSIVLLRLLDVTLVFNSVYLTFPWIKTLFNSPNSSRRSVLFFLPYYHHAPVVACNETGTCRCVLIPQRFIRFICRSTNRTICLFSVAYGVVCALTITFIFNVRGDHLYFYEYQAVKFSLLIQTFHVSLNLLLWALTSYKYNKLIASLGTKKTLVKQVKVLTPTKNSFFVNPLTVPDSSSSNDSSHTINCQSGINPGSCNDIPQQHLAAYFGNIPSENLSYYLWISIGNFLAYSPFLWFYLIALLFKPHFLNEMLNMQGLIGFLGTLFDLGACVPVFVAIFHDKSLRLSFSDLLYCRFVGRKTGNMELLT